MDSNNRKRLFALLATGALLGSMGTVAALSTTGLATEKITLLSGEVADSDFIRQSYDTQVKGQQKVDVDLTLENTDSTSHSANVTVQLLDSSGAILVESTKQTGSIAGGDTYSDRWTFQADNLTSQYAETYIIIDQTQ